MVSENVPSLVMWRDLSPYPERLVPTTTTSPHILIVGGGVTGLVTAWVLLDKGYRVTILSKEWANYGSGSTPSTRRLTAQIAGALWEFPPAVCGSHTDRISLSNSKRWCMVAYHAWDALASVPALGRDAGVRMRPSGFFFPQKVEEDPAQWAKMVEIMRSGVRGFRHDAGLVAQRGVDPNYGKDVVVGVGGEGQEGSQGVVDAYELLAPIIDTDQAMMWLMSLVLNKGAATVTETIQGDLLDQEARLRARFHADALVNATGLAGTELAGDDSCYPIRGALLRVRNDGTDFPPVTSALTITADAVHDANEIVFLVPRNDQILLLGGLAQAHEHALDLTPASPIVQRMRRRCEAFLPCLARARVDALYPLAQGLRPFRARNVRVERELRPLPGGLPGTGTRTRPSRIVHSYGQGGAGWSLSFGCAGDVAELVEEALKDVVPTPMDFDGSYLEDHGHGHGHGYETPASSTSSQC